MRKILLFSILINFLVIKTFAQNKLTLQQCIDYGLENNLALMQIQGDNEKLHIKEQAIKNNRLPGAEINATQRFNFGRSLNRENVYQDVSSHNTNLDLNIELTLFDGFATKNSIRENRSNIYASVENIHAKEDELWLQIANLFYRSAVYKEIYRITIDQKRLTQEQIRQTKTRVEAGMESKGVLLEIEARLAEDELIITEAKGNADIALIELAQLINYPEEDDIIFDIDISPTSDDFSAITHSAKEIKTDSFPQTKATHHVLEGLKWAYRKTRSGYLPALTLGGSIGSSYYKQSGITNAAFTEQIKNNRQTYLYVALRIPLFDRFVTRNNLRGIKIDIANQQLALQEIRNNLNKEALKTESDLQNARQKLYAADQSVNANKEAFRFAGEKYNAGKLSVYEHSQAKQKLAESQSKAVQAKYELQYKLLMHSYYFDKEIDK